MINYFHLSHFIFYFIEYIKSFLEVLMNNYRNNKYQCRNTQCINTFPTENDNYCNCSPKACPAQECNQCVNDNNCYSNTCNYDFHNKSLAMAYVPWQKWSKVLCASEGLENGTIFPDLILPFLGCRPNCDNTRRRG